MIINPTVYGGKDKSEGLTATSSDIKQGKTALVDGAVIVGNQPTVTVPTPSISVGSNGLVTATSSLGQSGFVNASTKNKTYQIPTQSGTTIAPGTSTKTAVSSGRYTTGNVYVAGDGDLIPSNIKSGVNIFGVNGSYEGKRLWNKGGTSQIDKQSLAHSGEFVSFRLTSPPSSSSEVPIINCSLNPTYIDNNYTAYFFFSMMGTNITYGVTQANSGLTSEQTFIKVSSLSRAYIRSGGNKDFTFKFFNTSDASDFYSYFSRAVQIDFSNLNYYTYQE